MSENWYLEIDGIDGESTNERHPKAIDVSAWSWGVEQAVRPGSGGGAAAGKPSFERLEVTTTITRASPRLVAACASGKHIARAALHGERPATVSGEPTAFLDITMTDVLISSVHHSVSDGSSPLETVSFSYAKIDWRYTTQTMTGSPGTPVEAGWDVTQGMPLKMSVAR